MSAVRIVLTLALCAIAMFIAVGLLVGSGLSEVQDAKMMACMAIFISAAVAIFPSRNS